MSNWKFDVMDKNIRTYKKLYFYKFGVFPTRTFNFFKWLKDNRYIFVSEGFNEAESEYANKLLLDNSNLYHTLTEPTSVFEYMEKYLPKEYWEEMMYMGNIDGIYQYKHNWTRRYVNIDGKGRFYIYNGEGYAKVNKKQAISYMLS